MSKIMAANRNSKIYLKEWKENEVSEGKVEKRKMKRRSKAEDQIDCRCGRLLREFRVRLQRSVPLLLRRLVHTQLEQRRVRMQITDQQRGLLGGTARSLHSRFPHRPNDSRYFQGSLLSTQYYRVEPSHSQYSNSLGIMNYE